VRAGTSAMLARVRAQHPDARVDGVLVQRMAPPGGVELLLGAVRDPQFGPIVMIGAGGVFVEILDDTVTRLAPVRAREARRMIEALAIAPILNGARGRPRADLDALADTIARFAALVVAVPDIAELEINPLIAYADGVLGIDVRGFLA
jgi:succinyl-CoA synthetase beta subunit